MRLKMLRQIASRLTARDPEDCVALFKSIWESRIPFLGHFESLVSMIKKRVDEVSI
jgi:hypothetical protein